MSEGPTVSPAVMQAAIATYRGYLDGGTLPSPHPWIIHLETRSICNSRCAFCAASILNPARPTR
ncbi:MAG: hypothetical protein HYZ92_02030 [Candidatus Omnitrophica bacterium]|nr:hypothetical protein [Candidatus Omnitrophota bacterium]